MFGKHPQTVPAWSVALAEDQATPIFGYASLRPGYASLLLRQS